VYDCYSYRIAVRISWFCHLSILEPYILRRNGARLWTQSQCEKMSVHRALPVNHMLKGYHPNLQGPLPTHQSSRSRPGHRLISRACTLVTGDIHQLSPSFHLSCIHTNVHTICWNHGITHSKVWVWLCVSKFCHSACVVYETEGHSGLFCHTDWSL